MEERVTLLYFRSDYVVDFISQHPIDWKDRALAMRGGAGDQAGVTPTPAVHEFLSLLGKKQALFTQEEYHRYCAFVWRDWLLGKPEIQRQGVEAKLYRNFYPSMIDSLHV